MCPCVPAYVGIPSHLLAGTRSDRVMEDHTLPDIYDVHIFIYRRKDSIQQRRDMGPSEGEGGQAQVLHCRTHTHGKLYDTEHSYKYYTEEGHPLPEIK